MLLWCCNCIEVGIRVVLSLVVIRLMVVCILLVYCVMCRFRLWVVNSVSMWLVQFGCGWLGQSMNGLCDRCFRFSGWLSNGCLVGRVVISGFLLSMFWWIVGLLMWMCLKLMLMCLFFSVLICCRVVIFSRFSFSFGLLCRWWISFGSMLYSVEGMKLMLNYWCWFWLICWVLLQMFFSWFRSVVFCLWKKCLVLVRCSGWLCFSRVILSIFLSCWICWFSGGWVMCNCLVVWVKLRVWVSVWKQCR